MTVNPETLPDITKDPRAVLAIKAALKEDIGAGDATTLALVGPDILATGEIQAREECCVAGLNVALYILQLLDPTLTYEILIPNGAIAPKNSVLARFTGRARAILTAERTALNFIQRMCGTATLTHQFVEAVKPYNCMVLDTRKTTPCLRVFEKFAVRCGGGTNHRFGLYDRVLMKDNHRHLWAGGDPNRLDLAVEAARKAYPLLAVEIEVESIEELKSALKAEPEWIMLDNMPCDMMRECVRITREATKVTKLEASGGINLKTANAIAATGVDALSVGALTHSAPSIDLALEWSVI
ncbi:MAG: carboxylating nicotinate-nucleotide diphosphorylase [Kiritimatiellae bacterium]|jgi:nicotinate-nucleotide pyrophosphorylase (carboxylating)|nr:carboxylating nicotinate-nucleotide diphosphorylase [Kiritimatiellia bacterium]